jgi:trk system potassium uptake protein TrkA
MFVLIAGGGRTGTQLALMLIEQSHQVIMVEHRPEILSRLYEELPAPIILEGNATELDILEQAGVQRADVVAACAADDEDNLVICYLARQQFNVPRTIARINDPRNAWLFDQTFHVDLALNQSEVMASLIQEQISIGDMTMLLKLRRGDYFLVEEKIPAGAPAVDIPIKDLGLKDSCVIAAIIREEKVTLPRGIMSFQVGDEVLAITDHLGAEHLRSILTPPEA